MIKKKQKENLIEKRGIWNWIKDNNLSLHFDREPLWNSEELNFNLSLYHKGFYRDSFIVSKVSNNSFEDAFTELFRSNQGKTVVYSYKNSNGEESKTQITFPIILES